MNNKQKTRKEDHYICFGGCRGLSKTSDVCHSFDCPNHNHALVKCDCMDRLHNNFKSEEIQR